MLKENKEGAKIVSREEVLKTCSKQIATILKTETHHEHPIELVRGQLRWKEDEDVCKLCNPNDGLSLNLLIPLFYTLGYDKNSELYRKFYRGLGYSLFGYWEIFYWQVNNPKASEYNPEKKDIDTGGVIKIVSPTDKHQGISFSFGDIDVTLYQTEVPGTYAAQIGKEFFPWGCSKKDAIERTMQRVREIMDGRIKTMLSKYLK